MMRWVREISIPRTVTGKSPRRKGASSDPEADVEGPFQDLQGRGGGLARGGHDDAPEGALHAVGVEGGDPDLPGIAGRRLPAAMGRIAAGMARGYRPDGLGMGEGIGARFGDALQLQADPMPGG